MMKCTIESCPGHYEPAEVSHTVRHHGELVVIDHVPAEVCDICGDVLFSPDTVRHIESLLVKRPHPARSAPVYDFA